MKRVNVNGSGVGLGHPIGCTGARITVSLIHELKRRGLEKRNCLSMRRRRYWGSIIYRSTIKKEAAIAASFFMIQINDEIIDHDFQRKVSSFGNAQFLLMWIHESLLVIREYIVDSG